MRAKKTLTLEQAADEAHRYHALGNYYALGSNAVSTLRDIMGRTRWRQSAGSKAAGHSVMYAFHQALDRAGPSKSSAKAGKSKSPRKSTAKPHDEHAARELELYADNDYALYKQKEPFYANMKRKMAKGTYIPEKGAKHWEYYAERAARAYVKEFGGSMAAFSPATRRAVARSYEAEARREIKAGER